MRASSSRPFLPRKSRQPALAPTFLDSPSQLSIIIPVLNEARTIVRTLLPLQPLRQGGHEVIVVDGGSRDDTLALCEELVDQVLVGEAGRAQQMNLGARHAWGETLLFLHADTSLPADAIPRIGHALGEHEWGRFDVRLSGRPLLLRVVERLMNWRSCLTGIATGDQAIFIDKALFQRVGGFPVQPLMEDIEISRRLKAHGRPACVHSPVVTSSRRWEEQGIVRTIWLMWRLRWRYYRGADPAELARHYGQVR